MFRRALLLERLGRNGEAKDAYRELIERDPTHAGAHNNLARLLHREANANLRARCSNTWSILRPPMRWRTPISASSSSSWKDFRKRGRICSGALTLEPDSAWHTSEWRAFSRSRATTPNRCSISVLRSVPGPSASAPRPRTRTLPVYCCLASEDQLGATSSEWLRDATFSMATLIVERFRDDLELPPHHAIFNTISDADRNAAALERARTIAARSTVPVVNHPDAVLATARTALAQRLRDLPGRHRRCDADVFTQRHDPRRRLAVALARARISFGSTSSSRRAAGRSRGRRWRNYPSTSCLQSKRFRRKALTDSSESTA